MNRFYVLTCVFIICLGLLVPSCAREDLLAEQEATLLPDQGNGQSNNPCEGIQYHDGTAYEVNLADYPGFDFAFGIHAPIATSGQGDCFCRPHQYDFTLNCSGYDIQLIAATSGPGDPKTILFDADVDTPDPESPDSFHLAYEHGAGPLVLVRFKSGMLPLNLSLDHMVSRVGGICIISNIQDPTTGDEDPLPGDGSGITTGG